jgi:hypothetical protein
MIIAFLVFVFALFLVLGAYLLATHGTDQEACASAKTTFRSAASFGAHRRRRRGARSQRVDERDPLVNRTLINIQAALQLKRMLDQADLHITPSRC